jgi:hypothetical protein
MYELTMHEFEFLRCQFGTSSWESVRYAPMAFTEHGVIMLASILNSEKAIAVNIQIIRIYNKLREFLWDQKEILLKLEQMNYIKILTQVENFGSKISKKSPFFRDFSCFPNL